MKKIVCSIQDAPPAEERYPHLHPLPVGEEEDERICGTRSNTRLARDHRTWIWKNFANIA